MARFDSARPAAQCLSLEPATDAIGTVVGFYVKLADGSEAYMPADFVKAHFTAAPPLDRIGRGAPAGTAALPPSVTSTP